MRRYVTIFAFSIFLLIGVIPEPSGAIDPMDRVEIYGSAVMTGHSDFLAENASALFSTVYPTHVQVSAESLEIVTHWQKGFSLDAERRLLGFATDDGSDRYVQSDAEVRFEGLEASDGIFLPFTGDSSVLSASLLDKWDVLSGSDSQLVQIGDSPDTQEVGDAEPVGFWYEATGPQVVMNGGGTLRLDGSFTLFVHDVMIHAESADGRWSGWTGYREHQSEGQPAKEYEIRITTIEVHNGTFLASPREMRLYAPQVQGTFEGRLSAPSVTGRLLQDGNSHVFDHDSLHMIGSGAVDFQAVEGVREDWPNLQLDADGDFEVRGASTVDVVDVPGDDSSSMFPIAAIAGLALVSVTSTGLARQGLLPVPVPALQYRWHRMWMERGRHSSDLGRFLLAARHYRRATRLEPSEPLAWYEWAHAELLAGRAQRVDGIASRARAVPGMDPLDLLDLQASAALAEGNMLLFEVYMESIAKEAPELAQGLIRELEVDTSKLSPELRGMIGTGSGPGTEGEIDGYA